MICKDSEDWIWITDVGMNEGCVVLDAANEGSACGTVPAGNTENMYGFTKANTGQSIPYMITIFTPHTYLFW
jgi:hypothetical protein